MKARGVSIIKNNLVASSGKNLEVLTRYPREHRVRVVKAKAIKQLNGAGVLYVLYSDKAWASVRFVSYQVLKDWLVKKHTRLGWPGK